MKHSIKKTDHTTYVCVPGSAITRIVFAMRRDGLADDIVAYVCRHPAVKSVPREDRERTFDLILEKCPYVTLEQGTKENEPKAYNNFIMHMASIIVSNYDETDLLNYIIEALNDRELRVLYNETSLKNCLGN